jgi:hypothetical protein
VADARQIVSADRFLVHALELKPDLPAAQLHRSEPTEHEAHVDAGTVAAKVREQATAGHPTLELPRVVVFELLLGQQFRIRHVLCLPDVGVTLAPIDVAPKPPAVLCAECCVADRRGRSSAVRRP